MLMRCPLSAHVSYLLKADPYTHRASGPPPVVPPSSPAFSKNAALSSRRLGFLQKGKEKRAKRSHETRARSAKCSRVLSKSEKLRKESAEIVILVVMSK